ncbi:MAG: glycosyl hydrolase family 28-related protein [Phycisphaerales bacterium]|jgi:hypothetical protein|nr:glycosyl hydrolase family 28-related protein [Phycisphaerales bacterium]
MLTAMLVQLAALPDFSRAGCPPLPPPRRIVSVVEYGGVADDDVGDAAAIQSAIDAVGDGGGAVRIPSGRWILEKPIRISKSNIRLLGDPAGGTILSCPEPLAELRGADRKWSWSGGLLTLSPGGRDEVVADIVSDEADGAHSFTAQWIDDGNRLTAGEWVQIRWFNDTGEDSLLQWLYGDAVDPPRYGSELKASDKYRIVTWVRVLAVDDDRVMVEPPLPAPLRPTWNPVVVRRPYLQHCAVRDLTFDFREEPYPGHLKERGFNAIAGNGLVECYLSGIRTRNADSGILLGTCGFTTVRDVAMSGRTMHHPICLSGCSHCLVEDFVIDAPHRHGTTLSWSSHFNVFHRGRGRELAMDCHRACAFRNLHQDIVIEQRDTPKQPLRSGGALGRGPHSARENVYWDIQLIFPGGGPPFKVRLMEDWPLGVFIGWHGNREIDMSPAAGGQIVKHVGEVPPPGPWQRDPPSKSTPNP